MTTGPYSNSNPQPVVIDASVWVASFIRVDVNHSASYEWISNHTAQDGRIFAPTILLAEAAAAVARRTGKAKTGLNALSTLEALVLIEWVQVDFDLARETAQTAATLGLRGADAIYVVVAKRWNVPLLSLDNEQLTKAASVITTIRP